MKKLIATIILILGITGGTISAETIQFKTVTLPIVYISHSQGVYYGHTDKDAEGMGWVVEVEPRFGESIIDIGYRLVGKNVTIGYTERGDEAEILFSSIRK